MNKQTSSFRMDPRYRYFAERIARAEDRSFSGFVQAAIAAAIDSKISVLSKPDIEKWNAIRRDPEQSPAKKAKAKRVSKVHVDQRATQEPAVKTKV
jgi:hypothetical protein